MQFARGHHPQRSETRTEPAEENLQHLRLRRHQGGAQEALPAAGERQDSTLQAFSFPKDFQVKFGLDLTSFFLHSFSPSCSQWRWRSSLQTGGTTCWPSRKESATKFTKGAEYKLQQPLKQAKDDVVLTWKHCSSIAQRYLANCVAFIFLCDNGINSPV